MPLSAAPVSRIHEHTRSGRFAGHARADGVRDREAHPTDVKSDDYAPDTRGEAVRLYYPRWQSAATTGID